MPGCVAVSVAVVVAVGVVVVVGVWWWWLRCCGGGDGVCCGVWGAQQTNGHGACSLAGRTAQSMSIEQFVSLVDAAGLLGQGTGGRAACVRAGVRVGRLSHPNLFFLFACVCGVTVCSTSRWFCASEYSRGGGGVGLG